MGEKRDITIPEPISIMVAGEAWTFGRTVRHVIDTDPVFNATGPGIRAGARILAALDKSGDKAGEKMSVDEDDRKLLNKSLEEPPAGWIPQLAVKDKDGNEQPLPKIPGRFFLTYIDATTLENTRPSN